MYVNIFLSIGNDGCIWMSILFVSRLSYNSLRSRRSLSDFWRLPLNSIWKKFRSAERYRIIPFWRVLLSLSQIFLFIIYAQYQGIVSSISERIHLHLNFYELMSSSEGLYEVAYLLIYFLHFIPQNTNFVVLT